MLCTIFKVYKIQTLYFIRFQNGGKKAILAIIAHTCPMHGDDTNFPTETRLFSHSKRIGFDPKISLKRIGIVGGGGIFGEIPNENLSCVIHISK